MKPALLHYWLTNMRGGESVLAEFCKMWPEANIYTHAYEPEQMPEVIRNHKILTTFISRLPGGRRNYRKYLPLMPLALRQLDLSGYDLIISSESGPIKGIRKPSTSVHICYCHTPMRYLWDMYDDYYRQAGICEKMAMRCTGHYLRNYDLKSAESVDHFLSNSAFVAGRIKRIYDRDATVIHPPVDIDFFRNHKHSGSKDYYLLAGELVSYKRPDLAIAACSRMNRKLVIAGTGNMLDELKKTVHPGVTFTGRVSNEELRQLYVGAKALIFPGVEDFGIVPIEAQATGTPVIALGTGGALETVVSNVTGVFFEQQEVESLCEAIETFESKTFQSDVLVANAEKFSRERFHKEISAFIQKHV